jgi:hypothetical protein
MSVCFVVVPAAVAVAWPILTGAISAACAALGFRGVRPASQEVATEVGAEREREVEFELAAARAQEIGSEPLTLSDGEVTARFYRDEHGQCKLHVGGKKSEQELIETGRTLLQRVRQQLTYQRVMDELKQKGYTVVEEQVANDQSIRLRVRSW